MSNGLNPDQDQHFVRRDLGQICLQRLSADSKSPLARKKLMFIMLMSCTNLNYSAVPL